MERIIYTNYDMDFWRDEAIEICNNEEDDEDAIQRECECIARDEWDLFTECFEKHLKTHNCVAIGSIGRWNGNFDGHQEVENMSDFYDLIEDCWCIELKEENDGGLGIRCSHHDGTNYYTIYDYDNGIKPFKMEWCL